MAYKHQVNSHRDGGKWVCWCDGLVDTLNIVASSYVPADAEIVDGGWTVEHPDGTTGLGRAPFATQEDAQAWCDAHPHFPGMSQG